MTMLSKNVPSEDVNQDSAPDLSPEDQLAAQFAQQNGAYYARQFSILGGASNYTFTFNWAAALFGPLWLGGRGLWGLFWPFLLAETMALVQICRGLFGELGAEQLARSERLTQRAVQRAEQAQVALSEGASNAGALLRSSEAFQKSAAQAQTAADAAMDLGPMLVTLGVLMMVLIRFMQGALGNWSLERLFMRWRSKRNLSSGFSPLRMLGAGFLMSLVYPVTCFRFTVASPPEWLIAFPADKSLHKSATSGVDGLFEWLTLNGEGIFDSIRDVIRVILDALEVVLVDTPWPIVMLVILVLAWRLSGLRVAIFTAVALSYLALLGFWEKSMTTVALLGTASFICILFGIPLGIWCSKNEKVYAMVRPMLDFMQTMPAFVYLIPVIAFFGTGKPPGIIATIIFGMPPVVRLTALGVQGVPHTVREAATAFGASRSYLLLKVDLPLAMPSIMAGINQTILMCLSMVVIASLIGAKGLGEEVLEALSYAAEGQVIIAGLAILFCAMVLDRIVQGGRTV